ncbi:hypothetical protein EV196_1162 [Mariniflexile fucanivorans]|uniref:Uncharacterized protein n=1 Tax=Mariniflexile fucanivorans TaxID=264023 RepID=A0A4R1R924_9FLAO|nr:hypothetical protein [Mariniflexile fucanivorans]TCL62128.1 hypothetical protein EV196_1162 [Mariniflexile fucanivorans]
MDKENYSALLNNISKQLNGLCYQTAIVLLDELKANLPGRAIVQQAPEKTR